MNRAILMLQVTVKDGERAFLTRNGRFERVLEPGLHRLFDPLQQLGVEVFNTVRSEFPADRYAVLKGDHPGLRRGVDGFAAMSITQLVAWIGRRCKVLEIIGAGEGNRTLAISLDGYWQSLRNQRLSRLFAGLKPDPLGQKLTPLRTMAGTVGIVAAFDLIELLTVRYTSDCRSPLPVITNYQLL
jgi:hypothetical protein